ncbi:MAG: hypothetical protein BWY76_01268 [bacterium ADurb.Bin429]|nr:MAG: hypothetical protein BWY76_01268 [bacterium ADurb.Bin429]
MLESVRRGRFLRRSMLWPMIQMGIPARLMAAASKASHAASFTCPCDMSDALREVAAARSYRPSSSIAISQVA